MLIDTHTHLTDEGFDIDLVIKNALDKGVKYLIASGSDLVDNKLNNEELLKYENVFLSAGYHPSLCNCVAENDFVYLEEMIKNNGKVVAIGEIGLDYHYGKDDRDAQIKLFKRQLDMAKIYDLPVVIHTRDAFLDTYNILKEYNLRGVIHCFSGSLDVAKKFIDLGYYLGIGGVVTFKNSKLKDVVKEIGIEKIVLETDAPYLSPFRGEKNEPCNVREVANFLSDYLDIDSDYLENITSGNAIRIFDLKI